LKNSNIQITPVWQINKFWFWIKQVVIILLGLLLLQIDTRAQQLPADSACPQKDLPDVIRRWRNKPPKAVSENKSSLLLVPVFGANPAIGFMIGVGGQFAFKVPETKRYSMLSGSVQATSKNQYLILLKNNIYTRKERIFLTGDWRFQIFSQPTYGLGTNAPLGGILEYQFNIAGTEVNDDSLAQPMKFNFLRIHQTAAIKVKNNLYLGLGYYLDGYTKINDERLRLNPGDTLLTSHYAYNTFYGFSTKNYYSSAVHAALVVDTRDNMINAYKGYYLELGWRGALKILGNPKNGNMFDAEWRSFHGLSKRNPAHLLAFWVLGNFSPTGQFPYMILPATAYDQRSRSARGYTQGRFRGNDYVYAESEYRFPISGCGGLWSGVLFLNGTTASGAKNSPKLFESIKPGYGLGLRLMLDKKSRSNLAMDYGWGARSSGFYLAVSETF
jgi:hypothetical protein